MDKHPAGVNFKTLLPMIIDISKKAGAEIIEVYERTTFEVVDKADDSPVTEADIVAHNVIHEELSKLEVHFPVLSEESLKITAEERMAWSTYWLVDPLDGTREFVKRNDEFSVNIALIHEGKSVLGVIYAPVTGITHFAALGEGAFKEAVDGTIEKITTRDPLSKPVIFGSRSHVVPKLQAYLQKLDDYELQSMGSSLKSCMVAEGLGDLYLRFGPTCEWDTAAAQSIVEEAGGCLVDLSQEPLRYNTKDSLLNPEFIVCDKKALKKWANYLD